MTMRKKKSAINMFVGTFAQIEIALVGILNRRFFIQSLSIDYLGCNAVFVNILEIFSLVCCGASAVSYLMVKAFASDDTEKIRRAFKINHIYQWLSCGMLAGVGIIAFFFLSGMLENSTGFEWGFLQLAYLCFLADVCLSKWSGMSGSPGYYDCIINVAQDSAVCSAFDFVVRNVYMIGQCAVLVYTKNYILYLMMAAITKMIYILLTRCYCYRHFPFLKGKISVTYEQIKETQVLAEIRNNIAVMLAAVVFNGTDNIVITSFLGVKMAGIYSNYQTISNQLRGIVSRFLNGMSMSVADYIHRVPSDANKAFLFYKVQFLCGAIGIICCCCFFSLVQPFIALVFGGGLLLETVVVFIVSLMMFIYMLSMGGSMFRHSMGKYWLDRNYQLISAAVNLVVSLALVRAIGLSGILVGTVLGSLVGIQGYLKVIKQEAIHSFSKIAWWLESGVWILLMALTLVSARALLFHFDFSVIGMIFRLLGALVVSFGFLALMCVASKKNRDCACFYMGQIESVMRKAGTVVLKKHV